MASEMKITTTNWRGRVVTLTPEKAAEWAMSPESSFDSASDEARKVREFTALLVQVLVNKGLLIGADMSTLLGSGYEVIE